MSTRPPWQGAASPRLLIPSDFAAAAQTLGCEPAAIRAVWEVEAAGAHFRPDGSLVRRFEPHHFPRRHWPALAFVPRTGEEPWRASLRLSTDAMFARAYALDPRAALTASSWGAPQIMGFNAEATGYAGPEAMVRAMASGAPAQLEAFVHLVKRWGLDAALRGRDWQAFARRYNGSGQVATYAARMEAAYRRHSGEASPVVLRVGDRGEAVRALQRGLGEPVDGVFGPETLAAVLAFQLWAGLPEDGVVGARTWAALRARHAGEGAPVPGITPPAQPTPAEQRRDTAGEISGIAAAISALSAAIGQMRAAIPPEAFQIALIGAGLGVAIWLGARLLRRRRVAV